MMKRNLPHNINDLRSGCLSPKKFKKYQHVTKDLIKKLNLDKELSGHNGCVNCLEWNETGELLASGSDDTHVIIWDPFNHVMRTNIDTLHKGNIFSVKFMPKFNNTKLASGAADFLVKVIDISPETVINSYSCHTSRVKRLAVCYSEPYLLWSCSEDGTVRQFDIREPPCTQNNCQSANVLINLSSNIGSNSEVKCLAINPTRSDQIAVGSNDPYVRMYDRRKLSLKSYQSSTEKVTKNSRSSIKRNANGTFHTTHDLMSKDMSDDVVQYFIPGHIPLSNHSGNKYSHSQISSTFVTFSPDGTNLLVNMGSEQVYLYDVNKVHPLTNFQTSLAKYVANCENDLYCDYSSFRDNQAMKMVPIPSIKKCQLIDGDNGSNKDDMPSYLNKLKEQGNKMYKNSDFHSAVIFYNIALNYNGEAYAGFYANRAAAYISRDWTGDIYAALLDSMRSLQIDYSHIKSHFRIAQCLYQLNMVAEAHDYINYMEYLFPKETKKMRQIKELQNKVIKKISDFIDKEDKELNNNKPFNASNTSKCTPSVNITNVKNLLEIIDKNLRTRKYLESKSYPDEEFKYRSHSSDYINRYCGHCNTTTDIKEANFFGIDGQFIMAGSDDGNIFFWDRKTENILRVLRGDTNIVNCLQPHPTMCMLATSGIDNVVRLWTPNYFPDKVSQENNDDGENNTEENENNIGTEQNELKAAQSNQERLNVDPFEVVLRNMGLPSTQFGNDDDDESDIDPRENNEDNVRGSGQRNRRGRRIRIDNAEYCSLVTLKEFDRRGFAIFGWYRI